ncbi:hypothetical protein [Streptomyces sp. NPDC059166]|uniref:hypothetical protein n=1 Tax=Streptomyces sp. NPDC059166 TaxID=3346752 RepID=UPI00367D6810
MRQVSEKDSENKQVLGAGMKVVAVAGATALVLSVMFVSGKIAEASEDGFEQSQ